MAMTSLRDILMIQNDEILLRHRDKRNGLKRDDALISYQILYRQSFSTPLKTPLVLELYYRKLSLKIFYVS